MVGSGEEELWGCGSAELVGVNDGTCQPISRSLPSPHFWGQNPVSKLEPLRHTQIQQRVAGEALGFQKLRILSPSTYPHGEGAQ